MEGNSFWLIYIQDNSVTVSLISSDDKKYQILGTGSTSNWDINIEDSLSKAIDESLSIASINANITEDQEPSSSAFVIPPFWVGSDGKIIPQKLDIIKTACKKLALQPTGYLAEDDAIVEDANSIDGFPASFILLHLSAQGFYLSLVYLGHIKQRITKEYDGQFSAQLVESALLELNSSSTLPPQIIIFGQTDTNTVTLLKDFPWVSKRNVETFLHFPEIKQLTSPEIIGIFSKVISFQMNPTIKKNNLEDETTPVETIKNSLEESSLTETTPDTLGFFDPTTLPSPDNSPEINLTPLTDSQPNFELVPEPNLDPFEPPIISPLPSVSQNKKFIFSFDFLKKIRLPKLNFKLNNLFWITLILLPLFVFLFLFFIKSQIVFFLNPYTFNKSIPVTLKAGSDISQISNSIIPVEKKVFDINSSVKINTTGQATSGEKSKGEITIFNKDIKVQDIPKGSILIDQSGKKFELVTTVSVAASSSNLDEGIMNLGQTKTAIIATDIGAEYNLDSNVQLSFKDYPQSLLIAKANSPFTGGRRDQILAVSQQDKINVETKLNQQIEIDIETKIANDFNNLPGAIKETIQTKKGIVDLSREVGEQAEEITGTINSSVSIFVLTDEIKKTIISTFLATEPDFDKIEFDSTNFQISFKPNKLDSDQGVGTLIITGSSLPKLNVDDLKKKLTLKTIKQVDNFLKKTPRLNRFKILNNYPLMPLRSENIDIQIKLETQ